MYSYICQLILCQLEISLNNLKERPSAENFPMQDEAVNKIVGRFLNFLTLHCYYTVHSLSLCFCLCFCLFLSLSLSVFFSLSVSLFLLLSSNSNVFLNYFFNFLTSVTPNKCFISYKLQVLSQPKPDVLHNVPWRSTNDSIWEANLSICYSSITKISQFQV